MKIFQCVIICVENIKYLLLQNLYNCTFTGADPGIFKRKGALYRPPWLAGEKDF